MQSEVHTPGKLHSVFQVVVHAPRSVRVLILGAFVSRVGSFFATFATLFLTKRGFTPEELSLVLIGIGAAGMVGSLTGGWLAERASHRTALVTSMLASSAALAMLVIAPTRPVLAVAACLVMLCTQSYTPAASALLVQNSEPTDRVPIFALFRLALNVGAALGPLIAGVVATHSYALLFAIESVADAFCALVLLFGLRRARRLAVGEPVADTAEPPATQSADRSHLRVWALCATLFGVAVIYVQYRSTLPLQLLDHHFTTAFYGSLLALNGFMVIFCELPISSVTRRLTWPIPLVVGISTMTAGLVFAGVGTSAFMVVAALVLFTIGEMVFAPVGNAAVAELSPPGTAARYQGLLATAQSLGFSLGPVIGITLFGLSHSSLWLITAIAAAVLCGGIYAVWRLWQ